MRKLVMCQGLPASGKSTFAELECARLTHNKVRALVVTKDDIREELEKKGWAWSHENEKDVLRIRDETIQEFFERGDGVLISADTNFGKHVERMRELAKTCNAAFEIQDFTSVGVNTCIVRDAQRKKSVGQKVIRDMYEKYVVKAELAPATTSLLYKANWEKPLALICDLDGTLALHGGKRSPFDYGKCDLDDVNTPIACIVGVHAKSGYEILYMSGREDWCKDKTQKWLDMHGLPKGQLIMRKSGDHRRDDIVKEELFDAYVRNEYNVRFVLDDRPRVLRLWQRLGLCTLAVGDLKEF